MGTNGTDSALHLMIEEEGFGIERINGSEDRVETGDDFAFEPFVNRIAFGIARELAAAVKQLEHRIGSEARRLGEAVERRLDSLQIDLPELSRFAGEQRSANSAVQDQLQQLTIADADLREANTRQAVELETLRTEARDFSTMVSGRFDATLAALQESDARHATDLAALQGDTKASFQPVWDRIDNLCRDLGARQEDIAATKTTLDAICSKVDAFVERLDRQADAMRSLHTAYSLRDSELEQIVDGLAKLRANPRPLLASEL